MHRGQPATYSCLEKISDLFIHFGEKSDMSRRVFVLILLTAILSSCAPASLPQNPEVKATYPLVTTQPATTSPTLSLMPPTPTPYKQTATMLSPGSTSHELQIIQICTENPFVSLENLGLPSEVRVVLLPAEFELHTPIRVGFWVMSSQDKEPQAITGVTPGAGMTDNEYQISPDGRWVSFLRQRKDTEYAALWVSSMNGRQLWPVKQIAKDSYSLWVTQQEIIVAEAENNYETLISINPFNLKEERHSSLPERGLDWYYYYHFRKDGNFYTLYVDSRVAGYTYFLFDHSINASWKVFQ
jgi:hypothetical protein